MPDTNVRAGHGLHRLAARPGQEGRAVEEFADLDVLQSELAEGFVLNLLLAGDGVWTRTSGWQAREKEGQGEGDGERGAHRRR